MRLIKTTTTLIIFCIFITTLAYAITAKDYYNSGVQKGESGDWNGAIGDFNKAIELAPNDTEVYYNRGIAKGALGNYKGAIEYSLFDCSWKLPNQRPL